MKVFEDIYRTGLGISLWFYWTIGDCRRIALTVCPELLYIDQRILENRWHSTYAIGLLIDTYGFKNSFSVVAATTLVLTIAFTVLWWANREKNAT